MMMMTYQTLSFALILFIGDLSVMSLDEDFDSVSSVGNRNTPGPLPPLPVWNVPSHSGRIQQPPSMHHHGNYAPPSKYAPAPNYAPASKYGAPPSNYAPPMPYSVNAVDSMSYVSMPGVNGAESVISGSGEFVIIREMSF